MGLFRRLSDRGKYEFTKTFDWAILDELTPKGLMSNKRERREREWERERKREREWEREWERECERERENKWEREREKLDLTNKQER